MASLWVRSQDKESLSRVNRLQVAQNSTYQGYRIFNEKFDDVLGFYDTKERCIEIIDEIQKLLLSASPQNAFVVLENLEMDYEEIKSYIERAREDNFLAYYSGCDSRGEKGSIQFLQPNVLVYEMPEE